MRCPRSGVHVTPIAPSNLQSKRAMLGCFHCQRIDVPLKACLKCRCVHYCGRECQKADWAGHKGECEEFVSALLGGERETAMPVNFDRRREYLRTDALELLAVARQESASATRALSCFATAVRCVRAMGTPPGQLSEDERAEHATASAIALVEYARAHAAVHLSTAPRRCQNVGARAAERLEKLDQAIAAGGPAVAPVARDWCALEISRLSGRTQLALGALPAARERFKRALAISSSPSTVASAPAAAALESVCSSWMPAPSAGVSDASFADLAQMARIDAKLGDAPMKAGSSLNQALEAGSSSEGTILRREVALLTHGRLHKARLAVTELCNAHPEIMAAASRAEVRPSRRCNCQPPVATRRHPAPQRLLTLTCPRDPGSCATSTGTDWSSCRRRRRPPPSSAAPRGSNSSRRLSRQMTPPRGRARQAPTRDSSRGRARSGTRCYLPRS